MRHGTGISNQRSAFRLLMALVFRYSRYVHATFLIGPAGSGKSHRCLAEVRTALEERPDGPPLLFIAPRQATYQIERELLSNGELHGYTRLQILSFDRLAHLVLPSTARVLSGQGRVMLLRALLLRHHGQLRVFRSSARLPGFAQQLSECLAELQTRQVTPAQLVNAADKMAGRRALADKLHDLAFLFEAYVDSLQQRQAYDPCSLLDLAAESIAGRVRAGSFRCEALWLDGFAELTPQELALLLAIMPACDRVTLCFCVDSVEHAPPDWLSTWAMAGKSAARCYEAVRGLCGCTVKVERLGRDGPATRFTGCAPLAHLEAHWTSPRAFDGRADNQQRALRLARCDNPEAEAGLAAQEILRHVRAGGRYRDIGVILRNLAGYHDAIRRVFARYEIPFFLDRREPVAHHPFPELTRSALRLAAFGWQLDDWLSVLKTGLVTENDSDIDRLEAAALERGWSGDLWRGSLPGVESSGELAALERFRKKIVPPFAAFVDSLGDNPAGVSGTELAAALDTLWSNLGVMDCLDRWSRDGEAPDSPDAIHITVWGEMQEWLENLELAFASQRLSPRDWIAIVDAGLAGFTVGVVPPALDQVLVGSVDRSRNPNLELAIVLGLNEGVFPAPPPAPVLLTEADREELEDLHLLEGTRSRIGHERYYGYMACTRARRRVVFSFSSFDILDRKLNPSLFVSRLQRLFPTLAIEDFQTPISWRDAQHVSDLLPHWISGSREIPISGSPFELLRTRVTRLRKMSVSYSLSPAGAELLYGTELRTSVTSLERFGECPFKFFVHSGLRAQERKLFQIDRRKLGDLQHRILKAFHDELVREGKRWRDVSPATARTRIARIVEEHASEYHHGLFKTSARQRFAIRQLSRALQEFVEAIVSWMTQYQFDPEALEVRFGGEGELPGWRLPLGAAEESTESGGVPSVRAHTLLLTGSIDRVDLLRRSDGTALCVVMDFKSSSRRIEPILLHNGIQLQLPAYLSLLRHAGDPQAWFGVSRLAPVGFFYVSLRGSFERGENRNEVLGEAARRIAYQHAGRFDMTALPFFDSRSRGEGEALAGDQFNYALTARGALHGTYRDPMNPAEFTALLDQVDKRLRDFGRRIFSGDTAVAPYRRGSETPCVFCEYKPVCRIDPWSHQYRSLEAVE